MLLLYKNFTEDSFLSFCVPVSAVTQTKLDSCQHITCHRFKCDSVHSVLTSESVKNRENSRKRLKNYTIDLHKTIYMYFLLTAF